MVADKLQRQEEERIQCSPTSNIDNMVEEEMDISTTHHKRKVTDDNRRARRLMNTFSTSHTQNTEMTPVVLLLLIAIQWVTNFDCLQF